MTRKVEGLSDEWAAHQLDLLTLEGALEAVKAAPYQPSPPVCRQCPCVRGRACVLDRLAEKLENGDEPTTEDTCPEKR